MRSLKALFASFFIVVALIFMGNYCVLADEEPVKPTLDTVFKVNDINVVTLYDGGYHNIEILRNTPETEPAYIELGEPAYIELGEPASTTQPDVGYYEDQPENVVFSYCNTADGTYDTDFMGFKDVGEYTVYFKITATGYADYTGSATVTITARPFTITVSDQTIKYGETISSDRSNYEFTTTYDYSMPEEPDSEFDPINYILAEGDLITVNLKSDDDSTIVPDIKIINYIENDEDESNPIENDVTKNYNITVITGNLTYTTVNPTLSGITASSITYGSALKDSTISGTALYGTTTVDGTFAFNAPATVPSVSDSGTEYAFTFTPNENVSKYFAHVSGKVSVTVNPITPILSGITASDITLGQSLGESTISGTAEVGDEVITGTWEFSDPTEIPTEAKTYDNLGVIFKPDSEFAGNYTTTEGVVSVTVNRITPTLSDITASDITLGQALSESTISGTAKVGDEVIAGTWDFSDPTEIPAEAKTYDNLGVIFTPDSTLADIYSTAEGEVSVIVNPISIEDAEITLEDTQFIYNGCNQTSTITSVKLGELVLSSDDYTVSDNTDNENLIYTVTVTGKGNYTGSASATFDIIKPITPTLSDIIASPINWGQALSESTISGTAIVDDEEIDGTWEFSTPNVTPKNAGTFSFDVVFTPSSNIDGIYTTAEGVVSVTVNRISIEDAEITLEDTQFIYNGRNQTSTITSVKLGELELSSDDYTVSDNTDNEILIYTVTVTGKGNYTGSASATFEIIEPESEPEPITPTLSNITASDITWGQALSESTISGVAKAGNEEIEGTWSFDNPEENPENIGTFLFKVIFTPDSTLADIYSTAEGEVSVKVNPINIESAIVTLSDSELVYNGSEQTVSVTSVKLNGSELSSNCYYVSGNKGKTAGNYTVTITAKGNYTGSITASFTIINPEPDHNPEPDPEPNPIVPTLSGISATSITFGDSLLKSTIKGIAKADDVEIQGTWSFDKPDINPKNVGTYTYDVIFTPSDTTKYTPAFTRVSVTVNKAERSGPYPNLLSAEEITCTSIRLTNISDCEYSINGSEWQEDSIFNNLKPDTEYTFYVRYRVNPNYINTGNPTGISIKVKTDPHVHEWTYSSKGGTITETCKNSDNGHEGAISSKITINDASRAYNGKPVNASIIGSINGTQPKIVYKSANKKIKAPSNVGTYTASITITDNTTGEEITASKVFAITKANFKLSSYKKTITVKASKLKKTNIKYDFSKLLEIKTANNKDLNSNKIKITKTGGSSKITINSKGKITIKKGTKKGDYYIKLKITVKADKNHKSFKKTIPVTIIVK